jgi:hypothetical protein
MISSKAYAMVLLAHTAMIIKVLTNIPCSKQQDALG